MWYNILNKLEWKSIYLIIILVSGFISILAITGLVTIIKWIIGLM